MTTIHVKKDIWKKLNYMKKPGESMDDIIRKLLEFYNQYMEIENSLKISDEKSFNKLLDEFCSIADDEIQSIISGSRKSFQKQIMGDKK